MRKKASKILPALIKFFILFIVLAFALINSLYPIRYRGLIKQYSTEFHIEPHLVAAIINVESNYVKGAVSPKDARGLMQIAPITGEWASGELNIEGYNPQMLFEPDINVRIGTWYLKVLSREFDNNLKLMLAAYNGGSGNVCNWLKDEEYSKDGLTLFKIPFKETEEYVKKVERNIKIYKILYSIESARFLQYGRNKSIILLNHLKAMIRNLII